MNKDLLLKIKAGDKVAFKRMYEFYFPKLIGFARQIVKSQDLAMDIVHDVFIKIWDNRSTLREDLNYNSYVYTLTRNHSINIFKQSVHHSKIAYEILINTYSEYIINIEEKFSQEEYLETLLARLPEKQSKIFRLCKLDGYNYDQAAKELNIASGTVGAHLFQAMRNLRELLSLSKN
ncbi:MAG: hypothetical protein CRN43_21660 [Candidatus Nephrothrix sp. EaCA]|nr:MAG: hypothetical protein CRN43_21660 [Candidatus Nephrothrix sp. EaCA]